MADAKTRLRFITKKAARPILKLINSAVANATNNFQLDSKKLFIKNITIDQGTSMVRYKPRAKGRVSPIRHRISKVNVILIEKQGLKEKTRKKAASQQNLAKDELKDKLKPEGKENEKKVEIKSPIRTQGKQSQTRKESRLRRGFVDIKRRLFHRKTDA